MTSALVLLVTLLQFAHRLGSWRPLVIAIIAWRISDLFAHHLGVLFLDRYRAAWKPRSKERILIFGFGSFIELLLGFATLYLTVGNVRIGGLNGPLMTGVTDAMYYSTVTMTTLGYGDFVPGDASTRRLVVTQLILGVAYLSLVLQAFVGLEVPRRPMHRI